MSPMRDERDKRVLIHVAAFEDDAPKVPSIMLCGLSLDHDYDGGFIVQDEHDFYSLASMLPGGPGYSPGKLTEVGCSRCLGVLTDILEDRES